MNKEYAAKMPNHRIGTDPIKDNRNVNSRFE